MNQFIKNYINFGETNISNLLLRDYRKLNINNDELVVILECKRFIDRGIEFPDVEIIADNMKTTSKEIYNTFNSLVNKGLLKIDSYKGSNDKIHSRCNFDPLYEKLLKITSSDVDHTSLKADSESTQSEIFNKIEVEFGRSLSPMELQTVNRWINEDHFKPKIILLALREAVIRQAFSLRYIDKILLNWQKKNLTTPGQVENELSMQRKHQKYSVINNDLNDDKGPDIPLFNLSNSE